MQSDSQIRFTWATPNSCQFAAEWSAHPGALILVVGPSGAGKDSLLRQARIDLANDPRFVFVRRTVTRTSDPSDEDVESVSDREFATREISGDFALSWQAHGLSYGLPRSIVDRGLVENRCVVANASRGVIDYARLMYPHVAVLLVTANPELLAQRLTARGRESSTGIAQRLARARLLNTDAADATIWNDGSITESARQFCTVLQSLADAPRETPQVPPMPVSPSTGSQAC